LSRRDLVAGAAAVSGAAIVPQKATAATAPEKVYPLGLAYENANFIKKLNTVYSSAPISPGALHSNASPAISHIQDSVNRMIAAGIDPSSVQWGYYQMVVLPPPWPNNLHIAWAKSRDKARASLDKQVAWDGFIQTTKTVLLDNSVQRCFTSTPPIPIVIAVQHKDPSDPDPTNHDIQIVWKTDGDGNPYLSLTMVCPHGA